MPRCLTRLETDVEIWDGTPPLLDGWESGKASRVRLESFLIQFWPLAQSV